MIQGPVFAYGIVGRERRFQGAKLEIDAFDIMLLDRGGIPADALQAPIASWILARIAAEAGLGGTYADSRQETDGGCFSLNLEVFDHQETSLGGFEVLGYSWGVELLGRCRGTDPHAVIEDFIGLLLAKARHVGRCRATVRDLEWQERPDEYRPHRPSEDDRNVYGWDGEVYLGRTNFWRESEVGRPWPGDDFRAYHEQSLRAHRHQTAAAAGRVPTPEADDDFLDEDETEDVVAAARTELEQLLAEHGNGMVTLRVYDLDGGLAQDEPLPSDALLSRVVSWLGQGFDAAWRSHDDGVIVKVWEYPASEPPWETVLAAEAYEPDIAP